MVEAVRQMELAEAGLIPGYFHGASPEHLELLGVDPTRLPAPDVWRERIARELGLPTEARSNLLLTWLDDGQPIGFSTADKIIRGEEAHMHLHILEPGRRGTGLGVRCVRLSAAIYFRELGLRRLFCEPNAFNTAPNRALQAAGFSYVKTHMTVPGPLNFHQAVTRWVMEGLA